MILWHVPKLFKSTKHWNTGWIADGCIAFSSTTSLNFYYSNLHSWGQTVVTAWCPTAKKTLALTFNSWRLLEVYHGNRITFLDCLYVFLSHNEVRFLYSSDCFLECINTQQNTLFIQCYTFWSESIIVMLSLQNFKKTS